MGEGVASLPSRPILRQNKHKTTKNKTKTKKHNTTTRTHTQSSRAYYFVLFGFNVLLRANRKKTKQKTHSQKPATHNGNLGRMHVTCLLLFLATHPNARRSSQGGNSCMLNTVDVLLFLPKFRGTPTTEKQFRSPHGSAPRRLIAIPIT